MSNERTVTAGKDARQLALPVASKKTSDSTPPPSPRTFTGFSEITSFIWGVADLLRGDYKQADYGKVILPLTVIRRLDCVLDKTKPKVLAKHDELKRAKHPEGTIDKMLVRITGVPFYNTSKLDFEKLRGDPNHISANLTSYIKGFSPNARDVIEQFKFADQIAKLDESNLLFQVVSRFAEVDLHPNTVPNHVMGSIFEELIRRFAEASNETAGEHFTPREVIRLMVDLLFIEDEETLTRKGIVRTLFDPACGTGGMLSVAEEYLRELNPQAKLEVFGQELNSESFAICESDMMIKGQNPENIVRGNSFSEDGHVGKRFDYMLSNPPFGVEWKKVQKEIEDEHEKQGFAGRFGPGLPRINDGSLLFLLHMISKMKPVDPKTGEGGSRLAIVFNGSPLFAGDAGSGESEIRKWIIENDWLEAIIALPDTMFYNTGISTYIWIVSNRKSEPRRGKVQLINAIQLFRRMRKSLGDKRNELGPDHIASIVRTYGDFLPNDISKIIDNEDFGYRRITIERPLRLNFLASPERIARLREESAFVALASSKKKGAVGEREVDEGRALQAQILAAVRTLDPTLVFDSRDEFESALRACFRDASLAVPVPVFRAMTVALSERDASAKICSDRKGRPEYDASLRDEENVPLKEDSTSYFEREVKPLVPDALMNDGSAKIGYEIPFTRQFYSSPDRRSVGDLDRELRQLAQSLQGALSELEGVTMALTRGVAPGSVLVESGIEWLGAIPSHWRVVRGRFLFRELSLPPQDDDRVVTVFRDGQVTLRENRRTDGFMIADKEVGYQHVRKGDLVLHGMDAFAGAIGVSDSDGKCSPEYVVLEPIEGETDNTYFAHLLRLMAARNYIYVICPSVRERAPRFRYVTFKDVALPVPPHSEQRSIARFVTETLERISRAQRHLERELEIVRDYRRAVVAAAVTGRVAHQEIG